MSQAKQLAPVVQKIQMEINLSRKTPLLLTIVIREMRNNLVMKTRMISLPIKAIKTRMVRISPVTMSKLV